MKKRDKNLPLTQEEIDRQNRMKRRLLWLLIIIDVLLVIYLVYQIIRFMIK